MEDTLDLKELFSILYHKLGIILLATLLCGALTFGFFQLVVDPVYTAETLLYVNSRERVEETGNVNINDINASQKLVNTYMVILQSEDLMKKVMEECGYTDTIEKFRKIVSMKAVNTTEVLNISVTTKNPEKSAQIANSFTRMAPDEIIRVVQAGSVEVISPAVAPIKPSGPHTLLNGVIGALLGAVLSVLAVLIAAFLDTTVKGEEDILQHYNIPVLGAIPDFEQRGKGGYSHYGT